MNLRQSNALREARHWATARLARPSVAAACFAVSLVVYLVVRLVGLDEYPISFLGDEAVQVVNAAFLLEHGFKDEFGDLLPTYLRNGPYLNLGTTVYLQMLPYAVFGYSVVAARAVTVVVALLGAVAIALLLRDVLRVRFWWTGVLVLSIVPAWFLHSRTAFEAVTGCSLYAWFLYLYLRFRSGGRAWTLYASVVAGALAFYSYAPIKIVVLATAVLFVVADARWLARRWRVCLRAAAVAALLALPQLRFQLAHPDASLDQLRILGSYAVDPALGLGEKLGRFLREYATGLDPRYWYDPEPAQELNRHVMKGYGNLWLPTLPFALLGLARAILRVREPAFRSVLLATAAAPLGAAAVEIQLPRSLVVVIPVTVLTALGLDAVLTTLARRIRESIVAVATLVVLAGINVVMLSDALRNGPTWYDDFGLYGLQYGGRQVARAAEEELARDTVDDVSVGSSWANGTDTVVRFFLPDAQRVRVENPELLLGEQRSGLDRTAFILTLKDLNAVRRSPLFENVQVTRTIPLPDGRVGFSVVRLRYSSRAQMIFAAKRARLRRPVTETLRVNGARAVVRHPQFDIGSAASLFDGDTFTLARTADADTLELRIDFDTPRPVRRIRVVGREMALAVEARLRLSGVSEPRQVTRTEDRRQVEPVVEIELGPRPALVDGLTLRISDPGRPEEPHIHVREIALE